MPGSVSTSLCRTREGTRFATSRKTDPAWTWTVVLPLPFAALHWPLHAVQVLLLAALAPGNGLTVDRRLDLVFSRGKFTLLEFGGSETVAFQASLSECRLTDASSSRDFANRQTGFESGLHTLPVHPLGFWPSASCSQV